MMWTIPLLGLVLAPLHGAAQTYTGEATYYGDGGLGACGPDVSGSDNGVALNSGQFDPYTPNGNPNANPLCGKSVTITANGKTAQGVIIDRCPVGQECRIGALDLRPSLFQQFEPDLGEGTFQLEWYFTDGDPGGGSQAPPSDPAAGGQAAPGDPAAGAQTSAAPPAPQDTQPAPPQGDPAATTAQPPAPTEQQQHPTHPDAQAPADPQPSTQGVGGAPPGAGGPNGGPQGGGPPAGQVADVQHLGSGGLTPKCPVKRRAKRRL